MLNWVRFDLLLFVFLNLLLRKFLKWLVNVLFISFLLVIFFKKYGRIERMEEFNGIIKIWNKWKRYMGFINDLFNWLGLGRSFKRYNRIIGDSSLVWRLFFG